MLIQLFLVISVHVHRVSMDRSVSLIIVRANRILVGTTVNMVSSFLILTIFFSGICENISDSIFICQCVLGWQGIHCETKVNYCENITCFNNGVCQPLVRDYMCKCLGEGFSGRYCEIAASKIRLYQILGKSFAYIAIITMISAGMFIVIMDVLKYCFGIDVTRKDFKKKNQRKKRPKKNRPPVIIRFKYVN